jgi:hypothetical protein
MLGRLIAYFFVGCLYAVGPLLLLIAIASSVPTARFISAGIAADGTIIDLNRVYLPSRSKEVYLPVFRFTADDGQTHMIMANSNANWIPFKRGDHVRVVYLKDHFETARIDSIPQLWMAQIILAFIGAVFCALSIWMIRRKSGNRVVVTI